MKRGLEISLAQAAAHQKRHGFKFEGGKELKTAGKGTGSAGGQPRASAKHPKGPNRTETAYGLILKARFPQSNVRYEAYTLKLADGCRYTPDWSVEHPDGTLEFHEIKGAFIFSKALTKPRTAAELFPQRFTIAQKLKSGWEITPLRGKADLRENS